MNCESCQLLLADAIYEPETLDSNEAIQAHLKSCSECREVSHELILSIEELKLVGLVSNDFEDIPERAGLDSLWQNLEPSLDQVDAQRFRNLKKNSYVPIASGFAALAACVLIFIGIGSPGIDDSPSMPVVVNTINPEVMNYLDRAQVMLMQVANSSSPQATNVPITETFARDMALEANFLSSDDGYTVKSGQKRLLKDIEFLLLQIANLDETNSAIGIELLQQFLEENNILFKIRLLELRDQQNVI